MPPTPAPPAAPLQRPTMTPDDTPSVMDPGNPSLPLQDGLPTGPGAGPQPTPSPHAAIVRYLPMLEQATKMDNAPPQFKNLVRYLQGM